jgi:hypothetical protein
MSVETITTVLVAATASAPASPGDLTDLATAKDELSIATADTSKDAFLSRGVTQASAAIASFCNRVFPVELVQDLLYIQQDPYPYQVPGGVFPLLLSRWPLVDAAPVSVTGASDGAGNYTGLSSTAGLTVGEPLFASGLALGSTIKTLGAGTLAIQLPAGAANPPAASGVALTAGISVVQTLSTGVTQALVFGTDYTIDAKRGWLIRLNPFTGVATCWEALPTTVIYRGGYATIPADLVDACLRLVTLRYRGRGRDPMTMQFNQPNEGDTRYWVGALPGQNGSLPPEIESLVDNYRVPVLA